MKRIEIIATQDTYETLSTFETIDQLNETIRQYKSQLADELNKTELAVLDLLHRYSAKYTGVSFLRKNKIAELIGKSRRTVIRVCQRLEALGVIKQYEMKRPTDMQQTSNAIVIQPIVGNSDEQTANVTQEQPKMSHQKNTISLKQKPYINNTYSKPYVEFKDMVGNFVKDRKLTSKLYGIYLAQTSYIKNVHTQQELLHAGLSALKITFQATKKQHITNLPGFYHGTLDRLLDRLYESVI